MKIEDHLHNRAWLIERLRGELIGPEPVGPKDFPVEPEKEHPMDKEQFFKPFCQVNGEEVLIQDPPTRRYGAGILFPSGVPQELELATPAEMLAVSEDASAVELPPDDNQLKTAEDLAAKRKGSANEPEDYAVTLANAFRPSALGLSFLADFRLAPDGFRIEIAGTARISRTEQEPLPCGIYKPATVLITGDAKPRLPRTVWLRRALLTEDGKPPAITVATSTLLGEGSIRYSLPVPGLSGFEVQVVSRPPRPGAPVTQRLLTVALVNRRAVGVASADEQSLFQAGIRVSGSDEAPWIIPYPDHSGNEDDAEGPLDERLINRLLYREHQTFAIGHGCSADWSGASWDGTCSVWSEALPTYETPSITADLSVQGTDGALHPLRVSMHKLAGLDRQDDGFDELQQLVDAYAHWIDALALDRPTVPPVPATLGATAEALVANCLLCLDRIRDGLNLLKQEDKRADQVRLAFRLANRAMLIAQLRGNPEIRTPTFSADGSVTWDRPPAEIDLAHPHSSRGYWRPFQIAFLLMSLRSIVDPEHPDREVVDLIWFPTGGGKTEAYLGLTAFTVLYNRLSGRECDGVDVLMRYTLRLLTAQQFQRAALLFCSLEQLRKQDISTIGNRRFTLGLWVGSSTTPNSRVAATAALSALANDSTAQNPFVLLKCPWCAARFGPVDRSHRGGPTLLGYHKVGNGEDKTVVYKCPDRTCLFGFSATASKDPLPVCVIDEDLIESPPNLLIGTVDKFAMLAWKPELRRFFGIRPDGDHGNEPPTLIIQDELHLISGPLGTMVGAYETVIDRLCREHGLGKIGPKVVASTATISRAAEQIRHLYARERFMQFPPSGLEAGDSFFAKEDRDDQGAPRPGRLYLGVLATGHYSLQTSQARVYATLLQSAANMNTDDAGRDPWWTLLCFFNSLRELGGAATLFVSDARDYLRVLLDRHGWPYADIRSPYASELTSRIRSDDIPKELARLDIPFRSRKPDSKEREVAVERAVDVCLASNIIEVGVDIPRLSLMTIIGQPKTTAQYIQVSSRVGRERNKPGLVVTLYGPSKPRDRSHYERFRSYHQRLYAQVEPTSVTPFSLPAVERALHGIAVAAIRQLGDQAKAGAKPDPFPAAPGNQLRSLVEDMIRERVRRVAPDAEQDVMNKLQHRFSEWNAWNPPEYGGFGQVAEDAPLLHPAGSSMPHGWKNHSWPTMSSMRDVDASCEAEVTAYFNDTEGESS